jgi:hypothetical protein
MDAVHLLFELNRQTQELVSEGYPNSTGTPNTWISVHEAERHVFLIRRANRLVFDESAHLQTDKKILKKIWEDCFRFAVQYAARRAGRKPIQVHLERVESLYLFSAVISSVALTAQMKEDAIFEFVGGMFQEERYSSLSQDAVYGLPYNEGSFQQRFFKKALRVSISAYGRVETLTPMFTTVLPSEAGGLFNPLVYIDNIFTGIPRGWSFEHVSGRVAFQALELSWRYSQVLKLMESSDEDFSPLDSNDEDD